ncbi:VOC family protein [Dactylosporangium sp. NPDC000555]|uniref:VOC family protein n=1 Tax=Dactylosporangium sp. NPDC000555 TaxID=3154260 RepID=UPI00331F58D3
MALRLNVIGIVVADMPRSLAFYRRLGLDVSGPATKSSPSQWMTSMQPSGRMRLVPASRTPLRQTTAPRMRDGRSV